MTSLIASKAKILEVSYFDFISESKDLDKIKIHKEIRFLMDLQKGLRKVLTSITSELKSNFDLDINDPDAKKVLLDFEDVFFVLPATDRPATLICDNFIVDFVNYKGWKFNPLTDLSYYCLHKAIQSYKTKVENEINTMLTYLANKEES